MNTEPETAVIPFPAAEADPPVGKGGYELSRFNAVQHGILSRHTVLSHEDGVEYADLLTALTAEHQPGGATEMHLVEELAGCVWRKRRVLMAEGAAINRGLYDVATDTFDSPVSAAVPFEPGLSSEGDDLRELLSATPAEIAERQRETKHAVEATERAAAILQRGAASAYDKALKALLPDSRDWWQDCIDGAEEEEDEYQATAEGLAAFIDDDLLPACIRSEKEIRHVETIKAQTLGEGFKPKRLDNLARYEAHLDRKFERTLAMLVKLKELRVE